MKTKACLFSFIFYAFLLHPIFISTAGAANKIMPLGDSITWDDRSNDLRSNGDKIAYRYRLWQLLTAAGYDFDFVGSQYTGYDIFPDAENEGWPAAADNDIAAWVYGFLQANPANIILLHIGTNDLDPDPTDVQDILDEIDRYEADFNVKITVILARIINRTCSLGPTPCPESQTTMDFNDNIEDMALGRINDKILIVDMEAGADIIYRLQPVGDMWDNLHPFEQGVDSGYSKMANVWFTALEGILPQADAGNTQTVKETAPVMLDGSNSSDPDGAIAANLWQQVTGTSVLPPAGVSTLTANFTAPNVGPSGETLTFKLTVTDNDGLESTDNVRVDVINTIKPVTNAGDDQNVMEGDTVTLNGSSSSDPDGTIVSYLWQQVTGTPVLPLTGVSAPTATFTAPPATAAGETLTFQLKVTDEDNLEAVDTVRIEVLLKDRCPNDPDKIAPGICGCGVADVDTDGDDTFDCVDGNVDNDGVPDLEEQGPAGNDPNYDGNDDGVADRLQNNVTSLYTYDGRNYVTIESPAGTSISNGKTVDNPAPTNAPSDVSFSDGFFEFTIIGVGKGGATTVRLHFPVGTTFDTYYKFGPTAENSQNHWYEFLYTGQTGAEINGNIITLHLVDGMPGDDDLMNNGIIVDIGGPGIFAAAGDIGSGADGTDSGGGGGGGGCFISSAGYGFHGSSATLTLILLLGLILISLSVPKLSTKPEK